MSGMTSRLRNLTVDCRDARTLARFWAEVLGWNVFFDDDPEVIVAPSFPVDRTTQAALLFIPVPEGKTVKNRLHFDVTPTEESTRDAEVVRLRQLGATLVDDRRTEDGSGWVVLADPEGNEFCVERSDSERSSRTVQAFRVDSAT
jgi:predicted enzyme related to lactoylglutathione lyase